MIILMVTEPRSGSTNLAHWFDNGLKNFNVYLEPNNPISRDFKTLDFSDVSWVNRNENAIISIKPYPIANIDEFIGISDKVFALYRENEKLQVESFINAKITMRWHSEYMIDTISKKIDTDYKTDRDIFLNYKKDFQDLIKDNNIKSFTYEDLYYGDKIGDLKSYLNLDINLPFPYGKKYRVDYVKPSKLI